MDYLISDMWDYLMSTVAGTLEYKALVVVGMLLALLVLVVPGRKVSDRVAFAALAAYLTLVFASTVLLRTTGHGTGLSLVPFSSYNEAFIHGNRRLMFEILENIALFMPAGLALGYLCRRSGFWASALAIVGTAMFSVGIECLQYIYEVGVFEFDDLFNNILGLIIGFAIARLICSLFMPREKSADTPDATRIKNAALNAPGVKNAPRQKKQKWPPRIQDEQPKPQAPQGGYNAAAPGQTRIINKPANDEFADLKGNTKRW